MKTKLAASIACILITMGAWAAEEPTKPAAAVASLSSIKMEMGKLNHMLGATIAALNEVKESANSPAALSKSYSSFTQQFDGLEKQIETVRTQAVVAKAKAKEHHEAWQSELSKVENPQVRERAQKRFAETKEEFDKIITMAEEAKASFLPLVSDMKDIKIYLGVDLTAQSVKDLSSPIWKMTNRAQGVSGQIQDVVKQIDKTITVTPKA